MFDRNYTLLEEQHQLEEIKRYAEGKRSLVVDLETTGLDPFLAKPVLLQIGDTEKQFLVDARKVDLRGLKDLLESRNIKKIGHNIRFDYKMLKANCGITMEPILDTQLAEQVLTTGIQFKGFSLEAIALKYLGYQMNKEIRTSFLYINDADFTEEMLVYSADDVIVPRLVLEKQWAILEREALIPTAELEFYANPAVADIELNGIKLDEEKWIQLFEENKQELKNLEKKLDYKFKPFVGNDLFGSARINYDSPEQLLLILNKMGIMVSSTDRPELSNYEDKEVVQLLLERKKYAKAVSTYGTNWLDFVHPVTGRIHASFNPIRARTGRMACSRPNLQNITRGDAYRHSFVANEGYKLITADYSGQELRILGELSGDEVFLAAFRNNEDLHSKVASLVFNKPVSKTQNKELREATKTLNFGLVYGMGAAKFASQTGYSEEEAEQFISKYFQLFPTIETWLENAGEFAVRKRYAKTIIGRKRYIPDFDTSNKYEVYRVQRLGKNHPIQGTGVDMVKQALGNLRGTINKNNLDMRIINTVHDEILVEVPEQEAENYAEYIKKAMFDASNRFLKRVSPAVEYSIDDCWTK